MAIVTISNYIGGASVAPHGNGYLDNYEPATGQIYSRIPDSDERDVLAAIEAAKKAQRSWATLPTSKRSQFMLDIAAAIDAKAEELAQAESRDNGKPVTLAREVDIPRASSNMRFFATAILHEENSAYQTDEIAINYTHRSP